MKDFLLSLERPAEFVCTDCGATFPSHGAGDGAELLCNKCYEAQFSSESFPYQGVASEPDRRIHAHAS